MRIAAALAVLLIPSSLAAQNFTGTYAMPNQQGGTITFSISQDAAGKVTGTVTGNGNSFQLEGVLEEGSAVGAIYNDQSGMYFQADLTGNQLAVTIIGVGPNNEPDYNQTEQWTLTRQGGAAAGGVMAGAATGAVPLPKPPAGAGQDPFSGTFSDGSLTLQLQGGQGRYSGFATLQGQRFPLTAQANGTNLTGTYQAEGISYPFQATLQGGVLQLAADWSVFQLRRQVAGAAAAAPASQMGQMGGGAGLSPEALEWQQWFAGKRLTQMESYCSGSAGGYSNKDEWDLCRDGRFFHGGSSSMSVDVGGASGYSGGQQGGAGQWRIIEQGGLIGLEYRRADGNVSQHRLDYEDNKTYIDGTRTFVTEDNTSCR